MIQQNTELYNLLKSKKIIAILDGDKEYKTITPDGEDPITISMPYLSGPDICRISDMFGLPISYGGSSKRLSRWEYFENLLTHCIQNGKFSELLIFLFSKEQFKKKLSGHSVETIELLHKQIISEIINQINGLLYFEEVELVVVGKQFVVRNIGSKVEIDTPKIKAIDRDYIKDISSRAMLDIEESNFDSAVTKSRTLLEEVFCYVIEKKCAIPSSSGNIGTLYKQVKSLYNMHQDESFDKRINRLLSGLENIVLAISEMRNKDSDSHGVGAKRIIIDEHHARLIANASMTMADFILSVELKNMNSVNNSST